MIAEAFESYAKLNGRWLQTWSHANAASLASMRIACGQWELATLTASFMTERIRAYAEHGGRVEPLVRTLDRLTEEYCEDYARAAPNLRDVVGAAAHRPCTDTGNAARLRWA